MKSRIVAAAVALAFALLVGTADAAKPAPAGKVNINTASVQQLTTLPGVGEKLAARIVDYRQKNGGFKSASDLMNVQGVGEKNFARIQQYLTTGDAPAAKPAR
jgi:competence protein ComEA